MKRKELERVAPESVGIRSEDILELLDFLEDEELTEIHSIMIARYGKVLTEGWWQPFAPGMPHAAWSLSKTYTATAIGLAVHEGLIGLDERMVDLLPEYAPEKISPRLSRMTVRNMLKMSSGISDEVFGNEEDWVSVLMHSELTYEPGEKFSYVSNGTSALGVAVAKRTGMPMREYLNLRLFDKIGINRWNTAWMMLPDGSELGAGGLHCTTEDTLRLMLLYENGGAWEGEQLLDAEYVKEATSFQVSNTVENRVDHMPSAKICLPSFNAGYGYQLWMEARPDSYSARGAQGQLGMVFKDKEIAVSLTEIIKPGDAIERVHDALIRLVEKAADEPLPENPNAYKRLKNRLARLSLSRCPWSPYSTMAERINGRTYKVKAGEFTFYPAFEPRERKGTGFRMTGGIDSFSFRFGQDGRQCEMDFTEDGQKRHLILCMDGGRFRNELINPHQLPKELLASAWWAAEDRLVIVGRWIESTSEKEIQIQFLEDGTKTKVSCQNRVGSMGAFSIASETADAVTE